jgi:2-polyprenyl-3-methyl-5-hydroxy-6-metoxy-1,4-benzoquinol methylase
MTLAFRYANIAHGGEFAMSQINASNLFSTCSDEEWLAILRRSVVEEVVDGIQFPRFPNPIVQSNFVGAANESALQEAFLFYTFLKKSSATLGTPITSESRVLDFGCGWGRFSRFFWKDVDVDNIHGVDIDPDIITLCRDTGVPGTFHTLTSQGTLPFPNRYFSHVLAYSVFTHLPEKAHSYWLTEIARVMQHRATFSLTLEPRRFLDFIAGLNLVAAETPWHKSLARFANSAEMLKKAFDSGEFVYLPTGGGKYREADVYGEAVVPLSYIQKHWGRDFHIAKYIDDATRFWQAVLITQRL